MSMYNLDGKVAIVTGAARAKGIGRATANRLAAEGASVVLTDVGSAPGFNADYKVGTNTELDEAVNEINERGQTAAGVLADVTDPDSVANLVEETVRLFGGVDILVNVAGVGMGAPILDIDLQTWNHVLAVNTTGVMLCGQAAARQMVKQGRGGRIVSVASQAAKMGGTNRPRPVDAPPGMLSPLMQSRQQPPADGEERPRTGGISAYAVSKAATAMLTRTMAMELAPYGITVNCVCPGYVETQLFMPGMEMAAGRLGRDLDDFMKDFVAATIPLGRMQTGDDVADMIAFLVSDEADYMTGQALNTTGGCEMHSS